MGDLYRAVWRWHFYAGLVVLPVMLWLATTGALHLYKPEIERAWYGGWTQAAFTGDPMPLDALAADVAGETGGKVLKIERAEDAEASLRVTVEREGVRRLAFVDPALGTVLGETREGGVMRLVRDLHSLSITGPVGNALIEIVAGWSILLVLSGVYLWWPRGGNRALALRGTPRARLFWRDLHASAGALVGAVILFLAITGMPWSVWWGARLGDLVKATESGRPAAPGPEAHGDHSAHDDDHALPWTARHLDHPAGHHGALGFDRAAAIAASRGMGAALTLMAPSRPDAPWLVSAPIREAEDARVLWLDAADGTVLQDADYARFGVGARAIEWGIATHEGRQYGEINRLLMLAGCIGIWLLAVSSLVMWWRRRLSTPPPVSEPKRVRGVAAIMLGVGALFPLTGATMLAALGLDWLRGRVRLRAKEQPA